MSDLVNYKNYHQPSSDTDINFKLIRHTRIDNQASLGGDAGLLKEWLPEEDGDCFVQIYHQAGENFFRQRVYNANVWTPSLADAAEILTLEPVVDDPYSLVNTNRDEVKDIEFNIDDGDWRIVDWFVRVTNKADPFTPIKAFPNPKKANLLCDEIIFESKPLGKTATMRYGYNPY